MEDDLLFDKIERYLQGKMSVAESTAFEQQIAADPALAEQVDLQRFELDSLDFLLEEDLREKFTRWKNTPPNAGATWRRWWWAPLLVVGIAAVWFFWPAPEQTQTPARQETAPPVSTPERPIATKDQPEPTQPEKPAPATPNTGRQYLALAETNYRLPDRLGGTLRTGSPQTPTPGNVLAAGIQAYGAGAYPQAVAAFQKIQETDDPQRYLLAQEWLGHTYFKQKQFAKAAAVFQMLVGKQAGLTTQDDAEWYLLLSLLPQYNQHKQQADQLLQKMRKPENYHRYAPDANTLAESLKAMQ